MIYLLVLMLTAQDGSLNYQIIEKFDDVDSCKQMAMNYVDKTYVACENVTQEQFDKIMKQVRT